MQREEIVALATTWGVRVLGVLVLLWVAVKIAGYARRSVVASLERARFDSTLTQFFGNLARWMVLLVAILSCLGIFGIETTSVAAVLGAAALAVGLAFQGTLSNFASGVMLLLFRPFRVGDVVSVAGVTGCVRTIGIFVVEVDTVDNRRIVLPNGAIFGATIENVTAHDTRRVDVTVLTSHESDIDETRAALTRACEGVSGRLPEPAHEVVLVGIGETALEWQARIWVRTSDYFPLREALVVGIKKNFDQSGIASPFAHGELRLLRRTGT